MPNLLHLPYAEYERRPNVQGTPMLHGVWPISSSDGVGVSLSTAFAGGETGLEDPDGTIISNCGQKVRYCISVHGYDMFFQQKNVLRYRGGVRVCEVSRRTIVRHIAEVASSFIKHASKLRTDSGQLRFGPNEIELKDLYVVEIRRCGSTVQAILAREAPAAPLDIATFF